MKRNALIKHLKKHGCVLIREGGSHSWWGNSTLGTRTSVPRHSEIQDLLAKKICKNLNITKT